MKKISPIIIAFLRPNMSEITVERTLPTAAARIEIMKKALG